MFTTLFEASAHIGAPKKNKLRKIDSPRCEPHWRWTGIFILEIERGLLEKLGEFATEIEGRDLPRLRAR
jgi:hypothetical protein